jgi:hypothetical protein
LSVVAGVLVLAGWTLPYTILFNPFSEAALVPPGHRIYLPGVGILLGLMGLALIIKGVTGRIERVLPAVVSTILIVVGIFHSHQIFLHQAPTIWSWVDVAWPLAMGALLKLSLKKG